MARQFTIIIPARYDSVRFPGKALAMIHGKTMIQRVYERCLDVTSEVYVATDDDRIADHIRDVGGQVIMTSADHENGSSRCLEAAKNLMSNGCPIDVVINIQGDEPYIDAEHIALLMSCFDDERVDMASLAYELGSNDDLTHGQGVYLTMDNDRNALYFSRAVIPYNRDKTFRDWKEDGPYYKHIGTYAYTLDALTLYNSLPVSNLEKAEKLEQLRWIENGHKIKMGITTSPSYGVDTPQDLERLINLKLNL